MNAEDMQPDLPFDEALIAQASDPPCPHIWRTSTGRCVCGEPLPPQHVHRLRKMAATQYVCEDCGQITFTTPENILGVTAEAYGADAGNPPLPELLVSMYWASMEGDYEYDVHVSWYVDAIAKHVEAYEDPGDIWADLCAEVNRGEVNGDRRE